ncbi:uncharacterized protein LOC123468122, partial [Daphnia magna]|uniref:uncharacterized protein LOC123468122 n=1 Tax=Daphnia magna TaxID=35525 RepID=UPI001E1BB4CB
MNDDVITGGSRIPRTPIQPSVPQINVPRPSEPTVARSLNFDKLHAEPQIAPGTCPSCTTPKPIAEPASEPAFSVVSTQPSRVSSQLSKLRSNGAYEAVARLDLVSRRKPRGEENNPIGSPSVRADIDLHITCETIPDISAESNSLHHGTARRDTTETRDSPSLFSEFWNFNQTPRNTLPTSNVRSKKVILPLGGAATDPSTVVSDRRPQLNLLPAGATPADSAGTASSGNQLVAEEIGQLPGSGQPEQRAAGRGDQTNTLPSQGPIATVPTVPYGGGRNSTTRGPTTSTPSRGENPSTTDTSATHRPPPYSLRPSSMFDPTPTHTEYTTQERRRRYSESRSPTNSVPAQSQTSQQGNLGFRLPHTFSRLQLLPPFTGSPITRFDSWLESFESIVDGSGWSEEKTIQMLRAKLTDRAFSVIQAILKEHPHDYESIKEALLDHFHGDENVDLYFQKFNKAKRKPGEKVVDYALRIQEIFKRAYPVGHSEKSFAVILMQKFIEGLDSKLQTKVKYKEFKDFNELVAATRVYALRLEALETDREKQEFIRSIDGSQDTSSAELKEIKQMMIDQKEAVPLQALFDTGASKSIIHERLFKKLPPRGQVICSQLDFDLYDVGEKKLHTLGKVTLPVGYGESILQQEFIITNGISEDCILGWDAIQKHAFKLDGESKSIYLARDGQGSSSVFRVPEMAVTTVKKTTLSRQTSLVIVGQLKGSFPYVSPNTAFIFTPVENLPAGVYIEEFIGKVSGDGTYNIVVENHSLNQVKIPRNTKLGVIEIIHHVIGKIALDQREAKPNEITEPIVISEVNTEFQAPLSKLLNDFHDLFASKDSELGNTNLIKHTIDTQG